MAWDEKRMAADMSEPDPDDAMLILLNGMDENGGTPCSRQTLEPFMKLSDIPYMAIRSSSDDRHGRPTFFLIYDPQRIYLTNLREGLAEGRDYDLRGRDDFWEWMDSDGEKYIKDAAS